MLNTNKLDYFTNIFYKYLYFDNLMQLICLIIYSWNFNEWEIWVFTSEERAIEYKEKHWEMIKN